MDVIVELGTPLTVDAHVHNTNDIVLKLVESRVSSQISRYSFFTPLIEDEIDHETNDSSIIISSGSSSPMPSEFPLMLIIFLWSFLLSHLLVSHQGFLL